MHRTPLASISSNRRRNQELSPYQRGLLVGAASAGASAAKISKTTNLSISTVRYTLFTDSSRHNGASKSRPGRPKALSERDERHLLRVVRLQPKISYSDIVEKTGLECHRKIVYRILKDHGITNWLVKKRPLLTPEVAAKRYAWCWERRDWTYDEWKLYIFSDECSVERGTGKRREWVFRTPSQKWDQEMIQPYKKGHDVSVMVWAAIWGGGRSQLVRLKADSEAAKKGFTANSYIEVLDDHLLDFYQPDMTFQQDNAPIHTAKKVKAWFEKKGVKTTDWPPYSPDLNCIEHMWFPLKEAVYLVQPDIESARGGPEKVKDALWNALEEAWPLIDEGVVDGLIRSMDNRVQACIAAEGWYTRF